MSGNAWLRRLAWLGLAALAGAWARSAASPAEASSPARRGRGPGPDDRGGAAPRGGAEGSDEAHGHLDRGPGEEHPGEEGAASGLKGYAIGLGIAGLLTVISFSLPGNGLVWGPAVPAALIVFAIAQMGVHLVFFLHLTTGPDNTNNAMALAFGCVIVALVLGGSLWIMWHLDRNMMDMGGMDMSRMLPMRR